MGVADDVMVSSGVFEGGLAVAVLVSVGLHAWMAWTTRQEVRLVTVTIAEVMPVLRKFVDAPASGEAIEEVRAEMEDLLATFMSNLHVPRAQDHFGGMMAQLVQLFVMSRPGMRDALAMLQGGPPIPPQATEPVSEAMGPDVV